MNLQTLYELQARASVEPEVKMLLRQLLDLVSKSASSAALAGADTTQWQFVEENKAREEIVLQFEHGGIHYKLMRSYAESTQLATLSPREQEIVQLVSSGHANKTIAHKLAISRHTVNTHVRRIFDKLGVSSRAEMVAYALQSGLVARPMVYYN